MKKTLIWVIAALILFTACSTTNPPDNVDQDQNQTDTENISISNQLLTGIWSLSTEDAQEMASYYIQFFGDGTWQKIWQYTGDMTYYVADQGTYTADDSHIILIHKTERQYFYQNKILRVACSYDYKSKYPTGYPYQDFEVLKVTNDKITSSFSGYTYTFRRLQQKPDSWDPRFFENEKNVSEASLAGAWDRVNNFTQTITPNDFNYQWWYFYNPNEAGIELLPNGEVQNAYFIAYLVHDKLVADGVITEDQLISIFSEECSWSLSNKSITLTCSRCYLIDGENAQEYQLNPTFSANLSVYSLTETFLILYWDFNQMYYVFSPGTSASQAPMRVATKPHSMIFRQD